MKLVGRFQPFVLIGMVMLVAGVIVGARVAEPSSPAPKAKTTAVREMAYTILRKDPIHDDDYPAQPGPQDAYGGFDSRQCTSFVAWRVTSRDHVDMAALVRRMGGGLDAKTWGDRFHGQGFAVDQNPKYGSVGFTTAGRYGHVVWVQQVFNDGTILIEDYNEYSDGTYHSWITRAADFAGFIHFEASSQAPGPQTVKPTSPNTLKPKSSGSSTITLQGGANTNLQGSNQHLQGGNPQLLQGSNQNLQGNSTGGAGSGSTGSASTGSGGAPHPSAPPPTSQAPPPPQQPIFTVMNTSETPPDGVWFRNSPHTADTSRITGLGVYANERVQLKCYAWGDAVGPYNDSLWYYVANVTRPTNNGAPNVGYLNAHYINDNQIANVVDPGVPAC